ncbi:MAG: hypothetical protein ACI95C_002248 [Pseudohongiellaceae bacterium]|jgi:hypothetical protein
MASSRATGSQLQPLPAALGAFPHSIKSPKKRSFYCTRRAALMWFPLTARISTDVVLNDDICGFDAT